MTMLNHKMIKIRPVLLACFLLLGTALSAMAESRFLFTAMVEPNEDAADQPQTVLLWGPLSGQLPETVQNFRLYRSENGAANELLAEIPYNPDAVEAGTIQDHVDSDLAWRKDSLLETLQGMTDESSKVIDETNYADYLSSILSSSNQYTPFQKLVLVKRYPAVSGAMGRSYTDSSIIAGNTYTYTLTVIDTNGAESSPLGRSDTVTTADIAVLPAPENFKQVKVSGCDALHKALDDNLIHFSWDVPYGPAEIGRNLQTLGYDLFWSENDLGILDLRRDGINPALHRVNQSPISVSGPASGEGSDTYLAKDQEKNHAGTLPQWKRGQIYYYYLLAVDILGRYGETSGPLEARVVDAIAPRAIWGVRTTEVRDEVNPLLPRLALAWDRSDRTNFAREYGPGKTICSADDESICFTNPKGSCSETQTLSCEFFDVAAYHIFRYDSPEEAMLGNGLDADGDLWIDLDPLDSDLWIDGKYDPDPCDPAKPGGFPDNHVAVIAAGNNETEISPGHVQITFVDEEVTEEDVGRVFWYRVVALDGANNAGPVSPPIRGILYNRTQPQASAYLQDRHCTDEAAFIDSASCPATPEADDILLFIDPEKQASRYSLNKQCSDGAFLMGIGDMDSSGTTHVTGADFALYDCKDPFPCPDWAPGIYYAKFYDQDGNYLARSDIVLGDLCAPSFQGCVQIDENCSWEVISTEGGLGQVPEDGLVQVCVELENGQMARLYQQSDGKSSPFAYITTEGCDFSESSSCTSCIDVDNLLGLTAEDACLGVRVFSRHHVGSTMQNLGCLEMIALPQAEQQAELTAPMIASIEPALDMQGFDIRWAAQGSALQTFTLQAISQDESRLKGINRTNQDDSFQFSYQFELADEDLDKKWCFKLRGVNSAMQLSPWSNEVCAAYETTPPETYLSWPHVSEPPLAERQFTAFYLDGAAGGQDYAEPAIVLSDDLTALLTAQNSGCIGDLISCPGADPKLSCLDSGPQPISDCRVCALAESSLFLSNFIVYRQQQGEDFVQVSPLVEKLHCSSEQSDTVSIDTLDDPLIYLLNILDSAVAGGVSPDEVNGARLVFRDRYPHIQGSTLRYKILATDARTGEIKHIQMTNWVEIPENN